MLGCSVYIRPLYNEASLSISRSDLTKKHIAYQIQPEAIENDFDELTSEIMEREIQNQDDLVEICEHKLKLY